jgi:CheY-like chemotaxis protein
MQALHPKIVFYADDDADDRDLFIEMVQQIQPTYKVLTAVNGKDAITKLNDLLSIGITPCLIVLDMNMPIMDGSETLMSIRSFKNWDEVPVCIYSTSVRTRYADIALKYEVDIIQKPCSSEALRQSVEEILPHCKE